MLARPARPVKLDLGLIDMEDAPNAKRSVQNVFIAIVINALPAISSINSTMQAYAFLSLLIRCLALMVSSEIKAKFVRQHVLTFIGFTQILRKIAVLLSIALTIAPTHRKYT